MTGGLPTRAIAVESFRLFPPDKSFDFLWTWGCRPKRQTPQSATYDTYCNTKNIIFDAKAFVIVLFLSLSKTKLFTLTYYNSYVKNMTEK